MSAQSGLTPNEDEWAAAEPPTTDNADEAGRAGAASAEWPSADNGNAPAEDSPELLRWRADVLMDEMMLGGVDMAAGAFDTGIGPTRGAPTEPAPAQPGQTLPYSSAGPRVHTDAEVGRADELQPTYPHTSSPGADRWETTFAGIDEAESLHAENAMLRPPSAQMVVDNQAAAAPSLGPVVRGGLGAAGASSAAGGGRHVNLLPRASAGDVETMRTESLNLRQELDATLPQGHEWSERAGHLLDKADNILSEAPERSAEVEYYLQQVRAILDRTQQSLLWSKTYYKRLRLYLIAWVLLSVVGIAATLLYPVALGENIAYFLNATAGDVIARHAAALLGAVFAGTLGSAVGALVNMQRHREVEHGFFDRKYSLRGLILPVIGAFFGIFLYVLFGIVYQVADVDPSVSLLAALLPAVLSFIFGLGQESVYGTRD